MYNVSLIVMERGSQWPEHVPGVEDVVAVGGDDERLLEGTRHGIASLQRRGQQIHVAVLACNEANDGRSVTRRADVIEELLCAVTPVRFGRVVLSAHDRASVAVRSTLLSLAGAVNPRLLGTSTTVSIRFGRSVTASLDGPQWLVSTRRVDGARCSVELPTGMAGARRRRQ